jgi:retron-type reverse transcriptase
VEKKMMMMMMMQLKVASWRRGCSPIVAIFRIQSLHSDVSTLDRIEPKMRSQKSIAYEDVYEVENLRAAYNKLQRTVTPGIDGRAPTEMTERGLANLSEELRRHRYAPKPAQRVILPTPEGGRPLSVASTVDKVVQNAVLALLHPVFNPIFRDSSHGFRPRRSCHTCLRVLRSTWLGMSWIIQIDLQKLFDKGHHEILLRLMAPALESKSMEDLMRKLLNAGYVDIYNLTDRSQYNTSVVMGSIISPLCNNILLHELDCYVEDELIPKFEAGEMSSESEQQGLKKLKYLRYADNIILGLKGSKQEGLVVRKSVQTFLQRKLRFDIDEKNSPVLNARADMAKFLGALIQYV